MSSCPQDFKTKTQYDPVFLYFENIFDREIISNLKNWLDDLNFKDGFSMEGKKIPRQQIWYQEKNKYFCEQWKYRYDRWKSENYNDFLKLIQGKIQEKINTSLEKMPGIPKPKINSCLINKYRTGKDSIPPHRDCLESFGEYPTIANFSLGDERDIVFKNRKNKKETTFRLKTNSLFIMAGSSQVDYTHEIRKCDSDKVRYSLTFREYLYHN